MSEPDTTRFFLFALLGGAVLLWSFTRNGSGATQRLMSLALVGVTVIAVMGLWNDIRSPAHQSRATFAENGRIELPRSLDGHYYLTARVNGAPVDFVVDTGASNIVLTLDDARAAGFDTADLAYISRAMTANGEVRTAPVVLDSMEIGPVRDSNIRATVNEGEMDQSLLGMEYLQRFTSVEITGGKMVLTR